MNAFLTATVFLVLVAVAAYVIHRLNLQHADRIAAYRYSAPRPGRRAPLRAAAAAAPRTTGDQPGAPPATRPRL